MDVVSDAVRSGRRYLGLASNKADGCGKQSICHLAQVAANDAKYSTTTGSNIHIHIHIHISRIVTDALGFHEVLLSKCNDVVLSRLGYLARRFSGT